MATKRSIPESKQSALMNEKALVTKRRSARIASAVEEDDEANVLRAVERVGGRVDSATVQGTLSPNRYLQSCLRGGVCVLSSADSWISAYLRSPRIMQFAKDSRGGCAR